MKLFQQQSAALFAAGIASLARIVSANEPDDDSCVTVFIQQTVEFLPIEVSTVIEENQNIIIAPGLTMEIDNAPTTIDIRTTALTTRTGRISFTHGHQ